jgi:hypothetical protein
MASTIGGAPRAAPTLVNPLSTSTRISVASLLGLGSKGGAVTLSPGTGDDIGIGDTLLNSKAPPTVRSQVGAGENRLRNPVPSLGKLLVRIAFLDRWGYPERDQEF